MVNREYIVDALNKLLRNKSEGVDLGLIAEIVRTYCIDYGKSKEETDEFVNSLLNNPMGITDLMKCCLYALDRYEIKFNVSELKMGSVVILYY